MPDLINHPPHYTSHPSGVECITVVEHMGFNVGNAIKYAMEDGPQGGGGPGGGSEEAARWYVDREIHRLSHE